MYHVKLLLKYTVKEQIFYEESILQVDAGSFDEAYQKKFLLLDSSKQSSLLSEMLNLLTDADKPTPKQDNSSLSTGFPTWAIIAIIAGAVVIIAVVVVIIVVTSKKKKGGNAK